ncbi:hypothetical protein QCA50_009259 [Cerrena zonata]|uniref:Uncharacterized protein n=1 Tax=Cerrena zonata TaxID=2478898 RepID=A0AAW0G7L6_9APHY
MNHHNIQQPLRPLPRLSFKYNAIKIAHEPALLFDHAVLASLMLDYKQAPSWFPFGCIFKEVNEQLFNTS